MSGYSLRWRLLAAGAILLSLAMLASGAALVLLFTNHVERGLVAGLEASLARVVATIDPEDQVEAMREPLSDPRYATPLSGLYWCVTDLETGVTHRSRSLWDVELDLPPSPTTGLFTIPGPSGQTLAALSRAIQFESATGPRAYRVTVAEDRAIGDRSIATFRNELTIGLAIIGGLLLAGGLLQVQVSLMPIRRLARGIEQIRAGGAARLEGSYSDEMMPLAHEVNELLADREISLERARTRAADLAHALKTPLSVVSATADRLRRRGEDEDASTLEDITEEMKVRTDYQLRLARLRLRGGAQVFNASLNGALLRTITVLRKTESGEAIDWRVELGPDCAVDIDRYDLLELVGNLLENAVKWTRTRIEVSSRIEDGQAVVEIGDDGPGMSDDQIGVLGKRGVRLDESRPGSGFGLAIAFEIVELNRGALALGRSGLGGAGVTLRLALSTATAPTP